MFNKVNFQALFLSILIILLLYSVNILYAQDSSIISEIGGNIQDYFGTINPFYIATSSSMEPIINKGDLLIVSAITKFEELEIGDIIIFNRPDRGDQTIVSRIIDISDKLGERVLVTKGDENRGIIPGTDFPIHKEDYIGTLLLNVPSSKIESEKINQKGKVSIKLNIFQSEDLYHPRVDSIKIKLNNSEFGELATRSFGLPINGASTTFVINEKKIPEENSFSICVTDVDRNKEFCKSFVREKGVNQFDIDINVP